LRTARTPGGSLRGAGMGRSPVAVSSVARAYSTGGTGQSHPGAAAGCARSELAPAMVSSHHIYQNKPYFC
ncbi:MAG: hypothetical protein OXC66_14040, partial [Roseovarius sp.]|nr:hypothetical protein [Roseovarius sp.]